MHSLVGIDIGGSSVKMAVVRSNGVHEVVKQTSIPSQPGDAPEVFAQRVAEAALALVQQSGEKPVGAGVGCPGLIDPVKGMVRRSPNLRKLEHFPLRDALAKNLKLPVEIQNDANAAVLGETLFGPNKGVKDLVLFTLGTGVGGGVVTGGRLLLGADNAAAELGHIKVEFGPGAWTCPCGKLGCIEGYAGMLGIGKRAVEEAKKAGAAKWASGPAPSTREISDAAAKGDAVAIAALRKVGFLLGRAVGMCIDTFNPEKVVLGGGASAAMEWLRPGIDEGVREAASFDVSRERCKIERSAFADEINVIGAAAVFVDARK